jgi:hypothetical protein
MTDTSIRVRERYSAAGLADRNQAGARDHRVGGSNAYRRSARFS